MEWDGSNKRRDHRNRRRLLRLRGTMAGKTKLKTTERLVNFPITAVVRSDRRSSPHAKSRMRMDRLPGECCADVQDDQQCAEGCIEETTSHVVRGSAAFSDS
jgi:hypothetical protein